MSELPIKEEGDLVDVSFVVTSNGKTPKEFMEALDWLINRGFEKDDNITNTITN